MGEYIGLDVSLKETAVSIRRGRKRVRRGKCLTDPTVIANLIRKHAPSAERVVFETGSLSVWFYHALTARTAGDLHRCSPREGGARYGGQQDRR